MMMHWYSVESREVEEKEKRAKEEAKKEAALEAAEAERKLKQREAQKNPQVYRREAVASSFKSEKSLEGTEALAALG